MAALEKVCPLINKYDFPLKRKGFSRSFVLEVFLELNSEPIIRLVESIQFNWLVLIISLLIFIMHESSILKSVFEIYCINSSPNEELPPPLFRMSMISFSIFLIFIDLKVVSKKILNLSKSLNALNSI